MVPSLSPHCLGAIVFHSFGYSGHGFQLFPAVGTALAELIVNGATNLPIAPFDPHRFAPPEQQAASREGRR